MHGRPQRDPLEGRGVGSMIHASFTRGGRVAAMGNVAGIGAEIVAAHRMSRGLERGNRAARGQPHDARGGPEARGAARLRAASSVTPR